MRRRALLASQVVQGGGGSEDNRPPESTSFGFPLYLNTEYSWVGSDWATRERAEDSIATDFKEWLDNNLEGDVLGGEVPLVGTYGYEVFIDGNEVGSCYYEYGNYYLPFKNAPIEYDGWKTYEALISNMDNTLFIDLYK